MLSLFKQAFPSHTFRALGVLRVNSSKQRHYSSNNERQFSSNPYKIGGAFCIGLGLYFTYSKYRNTLFCDQKKSNETPSFDSSIPNSTTPTATAISSQQTKSPPDAFEEINDKNLFTIFNDKNKKIIFYYQPKQFNTEKLEEIKTSILAINEILNVKLYIMDLDKTKNKFNEYLKNKGLQERADEYTNKCNFILINNSDDIWFWKLNLIWKFSSRLINFFKGIESINSAQDLLIKLKPNAQLFISYCDINNPEHVKKLKTLRKIELDNIDGLLNIQLWQVNDPVFAKKLGISTEEKDIGNIYVLQEISDDEVRQLKDIFGKHYLITLDGFNFKSELFREAKKVVEKSFKSLLHFSKYMMSIPIVISNRTELDKAKEMYSQASLYIYVDERKHSLDQIKKVLVQLRKKYPVEISKEAKDSNNVLFLLCKLQNLRSAVEPNEDSVIVRYAAPQTDQINLLDEFLPEIKSIQGLTKEQFLNKCKEFVKQKNDDQDASDDVKSEKFIFSEDRFKFPKEFEMMEEFNLENLDNFIQKCRSNQYPYYFKSKKDSPKYSTKVVGSDFSFEVLKSDKDCLVYFKHPLQKKNGKMSAYYEEFVKRQIENKNEGFKYCRYNTNNETQVMKSPKSPSLYLFKKSDPLNPIEFDILSILLSTTTQEEVIQALEEFLKENRKENS